MSAERILYEKAEWLEEMVADLRRTRDALRRELDETSDRAMAEKLRADDSARQLREAREMLREWEDLEEAVFDPQAPRRGTGAVAATVSSPLTPSVALGVVGTVTWGSLRYDNVLVAVGSESEMREHARRDGGTRPVRILDADVPVVELASSEPTHWLRGKCVYSVHSEKHATDVELFPGVPQDGAK